MSTMHNHGSELGHAYSDIKVLSCTREMGLQEIQHYLSIEVVCSNGASDPPARHSD